MESNNKGWFDKTLDYIVLIIKPYLPQTKEEKIKDGLILIIYIILIAIAFNYLLSSMYKVQLLSTPCQICESFGNKCTQAFQYMPSLNISNITIGK